MNCLHVEFSISILIKVLIIYIYMETGPQPRLDMTGFTAKKITAIYLEIVRLGEKAPASAGCLKLLSNRGWLTNPYIYIGNVLDKRTTQLYIFHNTHNMVCTITIDLV